MKVLCKHDWKTRVPYVIYHCWNEVMFFPFTPQRQLSNKNVLVLTENYLFTL